MKVESESEVAQSCPTLSDPMDCSPPGSSIHGNFQARVLEWGAIAKQQLDWKLGDPISLFTTNYVNLGICFRRSKQELLLLLLSCFSHVRLCATL